MKYVIINRIIDLHEIIKKRRKLDDKIQRNTQQAQIQQAIEKRCEIIQSDQSKWIASVLDKNTKNRIVIDKLIYENDNKERCILLNPNDVKELAAQTFEKQFRKRATVKRVDSIMPGLMRDSKSVKTIEFSFLRVT